MRCIDRETYWENAKKKIGENRYNQMKKLIYALEEEEQTLESVRSTIFNTILPYMVEVAEINGCENTKSEREYTKEACDVYCEIAQQYPVVLEAGKEDEKVKLRDTVFHPRYDEIAARFDQKNMCHSLARGGYICYCDEV